MDYINAPPDSPGKILITLSAMLFLFPNLSTRGLNFKISTVDKYPVKDREHINTSFPNVVPVLRLYRGRNPVTIRE